MHFSHVLYISLLICSTARCYFHCFYYSLVFTSGVVVIVNCQFSSSVVNPRRHSSIYVARCQVITVVIVAFLFFQCSVFMQRYCSCSCSVITFVNCDYRTSCCLVASYLLSTFETQFNATSCVFWRLVVDEQAFLLVNLYCVCPDP